MNTDLTAAGAFLEASLVMVVVVGRPVASRPILESLAASQEDSFDMNLHFEFSETSRAPFDTKHSQASSS